MSTKLKTSTGKSYPLGSSPDKHGSNFALYSKNATAVELLLFDSSNHQQPTQTIILDPVKNRTFHYWHIYVIGLKVGQRYAYRIHGPFEPEKGLRFDAQKVLLDPYAKGIVTDGYDREAAIKPGDNASVAMKSVVVDTKHYDWGNDKPLNYPFAKSVIYEMHVGGFTRHHNSGLPDDLRGTYRGLIAKIPYLKRLGITTVELMPVMQFDPYDVPNQLTNYWGYSPIAFFAPHNGYAQSTEPQDILNEFRDMVKALHAADMEVILDVVFNHTAEGNHEGPTLSFKGIENRAYYMLEDDKFYYKNYSGTGNTLNGNHSVMRRFIMDCLRFWVREMHVDGFRFDLASVLSRDERGHPVENPPILWEIESDPQLASTKLIAEAWDLGLYQLGNFVGDKWAEWNGRYRDDVRRFVKGDDSTIQNFRWRLAASQDLFRPIMRNPNRSINFITCHDGFTLNDLVSYNYKHNLVNGEENRDGHDHNYSWNCGEEGPSNNLKVEQLRLQQIKNFITLLMVSQGTPMLLMGDEVRRTQMGNNNAYCQDSEISWFDWDLVKKEAKLLTFVQNIIRFNLECPYFQEKINWQLNHSDTGTSILYHGTKLGQPDWADHSHSLAFSLQNPEYDHQLHIIVNAYHEDLDFELPPPTKSAWRVIINTAQNSKPSYWEYSKAPDISTASIPVSARTVMVLKAPQ